MQLQRKRIERDQNRKRQSEEKKNHKDTRIDQVVQNAIHAEKNELTKKKNKTVRTNESECVCIREFFKIFLHFFKVKYKMCVYGPFCRASTYPFQFHRSVQQHKIFSIINIIALNFSFTPKIIRMFYCEMEIKDDTVIK